MAIKSFCKEIYAELIDDYIEIYKMMSEIKCAKESPRAIRARASKALKKKLGLNRKKRN